MTIDAGITYNADHAIFLGVSPMKTTYLLGIMGICNMVGKIAIGKTMDLIPSKIFSLTFATMLCNCVVFSLGDFFPSWNGQAVILAILGASTGIYTCTAGVLVK